VLLFLANKIFIESNTAVIP